MNHIYGVNKYTYARYCTETDIFLKLPELDPDPDLVVKFSDPDPAKRSGSDRIRNTAFKNCPGATAYNLQQPLGFYTGFSIPFQQCPAAVQ
jgi:hypothetical protein